MKLQLDYSAQSRSRPVRMFNFKFLYVFIVINNIFSSSSFLVNPITSPPHPKLRSEAVTVHRNYEQFFRHNDVIIVLCLTICIVLIILADEYLNCVKYVTFDTCLDYLPRYRRNSEHNLVSLFYLLAITNTFITEGYVLIVIYRKLMFFWDLIVDISESLSQMYWFLWYFEMVILLSADIEIHPGPTPCMEFNDGFFSFCNWNINTLSKNEFQRFRLLKYTIRYLSMTLYLYVKLV